MFQDDFNAGGAADDATDDLSTSPSAPVDGEDGEEEANPALPDDPMAVPEDGGDATV